MSIDVENINDRYNVFEIEKRGSDENRVIEQPDEELMEKQRELLKEFQQTDKLKPSYFTHSFMRGRNIVTAAKPHVGKKFVYRSDVKDFFTNIRLSYLKRKLNIKDDDLLDKLKYCFKKKELRNGQTSYYLPQGAPTSPFLSNSFMRKFDWRLSGFSALPYTTMKRDKGEAVTYTRYADDIFLSSNSRYWLDKVINWIPSLLSQYGLKENREKRKMMTDGERKQVCGIVVNEKLNLPRERRRKIRAGLHNAQYDDRGIDDERNGMKALKEMVEKQKEFPENNVEVFGSMEVIRRL